MRRKMACSRAILRLLTGLLIFSAGAAAQTDPSSGLSSGLTSGLKVDRVLVLKERHILQLLNGGHVLKEYKVALGGSPVGPKTQQGDHKTPEGTYILDSRNSKSQFYKSLHISYPTQQQRAAARKRGTSPGGDVFVHGLPNGARLIGAAHRLRDWTDGCIAVTD